MHKGKIYRVLIYLIASVWLVNGLICKVLNLVPRHEQIIERILGHDYARPLTVLIGCSEIVMAFWVISGYKVKLNIITQITVVIGMNIIELILAPELLLWSETNMLFAMIFSSIVYYNGFILKNK